MHFPFNILLAAGCGVQREPPKIPSAVAERSLTDENVQIPASCSCGSKLSLTISPRYPLVNIQSFHSGTLIYSVFLCFVAVAVQISRKWYISFVDVWSFCTPDSAFPVLCPRLLFFWTSERGKSLQLHYFGFIVSWGFCPSLPSAVSKRRFWCKFVVLLRLLKSFDRLLFERFIFLLEILL